jgi:hypothetical protein
MGQIGEDRQATPDVVAPVKGSPLASSAPYDVAPPLPRESVAGKPWKEAGRSHLAAAARVEASSSTVVRFLGVNRSPQARQLRERAKSARRTARALAPLAGQGSSGEDRRRETSVRNSWCLTCGQRASGTLFTPGRWRTEHHMRTRQAATTGRLAS